MALELVGQVAIPYKWKEFVFRRGCSFFKSALTGNREEPLNPYGQNLDEEEPSDDFSRKVHYDSKWKHVQVGVCCVKLSRTQDHGLRIWQTKSNAIIVHNPLPAACIYMVTSQRGDRTIYERLSTPRPAPRLTLKSYWQVQQQHSQQQRQHSEIASRSVGELTRGTSVQDEDMGNKGDTTDNQCSSSIWKRMRDTAVSVEQNLPEGCHLEGRRTVEANQRDSRKVERRIKICP